jgi:hypothetical protein
MSKLDVSRRNGEPLDAYISRLEDLARQQGLAVEDRVIVAVSLGAARALLRQQQTPRPAQASDPSEIYRPPSDPGAGSSPALDYCKALCRALSPEKQAQLLRWLEEGMPDGP